MQKFPSNARNVRRSSQNIVGHLPSAKGTAQQVKSEIDCLKLITDDGTITMISECTNIYYSHSIKNYQNKHFCRTTDIYETEDTRCIIFCKLVENKV